MALNIFLASSMDKDERHMIFIPCMFLVSFRLAGDVLMCTGFLSYSGPFNQEFRNKLLQNWQKNLSAKRVPFSSNLNLTEMLVDNATVSYIFLPCFTFIFAKCTDFIQVYVYLILFHLK